MNNFDPHTRHHHKNVSLRKSIISKITLSILAAAIIPLTITGITSYYILEKNIVSQALAEIQNDMALHVQQVELISEDAANDLRFLAKTPPVQGIIRTKETTKTFPIDESTYDQWITRMATIFQAIAQSNANYLQIRYIDENGQELVRIDQVDGNIVRISDDKLQSKKDRYYFTETMRLKAGEIYISPVDLNKEGSPPQIQVPHTPVIRYAVPIFDERTGERKGIMITNIRAEDIFRTLSLHSTSHTVKSSQYLTDQQGYYLTNPDQEKRWGSPTDLDTGITIFQDFPKTLTDHIFSFHSGVEDNPELGIAYAFHRIFPSVENQMNYWVFLETIPRQIIYERVNQVRDIFIAAGTAFLIFFLAFALWISRSITAPIDHLTHVAIKISEGDLSIRTKITSKDEIGVLGTILNDMTEKLAIMKKDLEKRVMERTRTLNNQAEKLKQQQQAIMNILEDVESEKRKTETLAQELSKFKQAVDNAYDHIVITDTDGMIIYANDAVKRITGFNKEEIIGKKAGSPTLWGGLMPKSFYEKLWKTIKIDKKTFAGEIQNIRKSKEKYFAYGTISPVLNTAGDVVFFIGVERDISHEKAVDRMKTEFISLASHQLRTPLSAIKWFLEILLGGDAGPINDEQNEYLHNIEESNERMIRLVNGLLNISRIESGRIIVDPVETDLNNLIHGVLTELEPRMTEKHQHISVSIHPDLPKIKLDPKLIENVYSNLLTNAHKYTPENGEITITVSKKNAMILTQVSDTGYGIPEKDKDKLFGRFFRASNIVRKDTDGTGLGLYLVKAIVESSGGKIWFESEENKGTSFWFTIPISGMQPKKGEVTLDS